MCKIPTFTKCCLCAPLREGLICYGCTHLLFCVLGIGLLVFIKETQNIQDWLIISIACVLLAIDAAFLVVLIVACHKKNVRLLKYPQVYIKIWRTLCVAVAIFLTIRMGVMYIEFKHAKHPTSYEAFELSNVFIYGLPMLLTLTCDICLRSYVILWIKGLMEEFLIQQQFSNDISYASITRQPDIHTMEHNDVLRDDNEESMDVEICGVTGNIENNEKTFNAETTIEVIIDEIKLQTEEEIKGQNTGNNTEILIHEIKVQNEEKRNAVNIEVQDFDYPKTDSISKENMKSKQDNIELQVLQ